MPIPKVVITNLKAVSRFFRADIKPPLFERLTGVKQVSTPISEERLTELLHSPAPQEIEPEITPGVPKAQAEKPKLQPYPNEIFI